MLIIIFRMREKETSLSFILSDVARLYRRRFDVKCRSLGITRPQWQLLAVLARNEGANQAFLADYLEVEPITLSRMIDRMTETGLIERRPDPADRRAWRLFVTETGWALRGRMRELAQEIEDEVFDDVDETAKKYLTDILLDVRDKLVARESVRKVKA